MIEQYTHYLERRLAQHREELPAAMSLLLLTKATHNLSRGWAFWELPSSQQQALREHEQGGGSIALLLSKAHQSTPERYTRAA